MQEAVLYLMQAAFLLYRVTDLTGERKAAGYSIRKSACGKTAYCDMLLLEMIRIRHYGWGKEIALSLFIFEHDQKR